MKSGSKRTAYTHNEKLLLATLVDKHKNLLEDKKNDADTVQQKQQEWERIAVEYNAQATMINVRRTAAQLKKLWNNLKYRKATTELRHQRLLTGGGPEPSDQGDPVMEAVSIAAPHAHLILPCPWDSTGVYESTYGEVPPLVSDSEIQYHHVVVDNEPKECHPSTSGIGNTAKYTDDAPKTTTTMTNPTAVVKTESGITSKHCSRVTEMLGLVTKEINLRVQTMEKRLEQEREVHILRMRIAEEQRLTVIAAQKKAEAEAELAMHKCSTN
ncbi:myb/SANT-like DNA-binding domain-containing protein 3 [Sitophilus oryzae]|uniref:Regulatory protein zeste n=1 Tax=Sitophilus oryzae TaxID=7048 RepID=A0A6J2YA93_SITOR|nr:myb/SANT-like DNA-binding domain-containing protein 3 [Sitophilus oryzae]